MKNIFKHLAVMCLALVLLVAVLPMDAEAVEWSDGYTTHNMVGGEAGHYCADGKHSYWNWWQNEYVEYDCHYASTISHRGMTDGTCDICGYTSHTCADADFNHICDNGCTVGQGTHEPASTTTHICDYCKQSASECKDDNTNHKCDVCNVDMGTHEPASATTHICDYCKQSVSECKDDDKNHKCDICGETVGTHENGSATTHICDYCQEAASECADSDNDGNHACDVCGKANVSGHNYGAIICGQKATCSECGDEFTLEHEWDDGVVTKKATYVSKGEITYTCKRNGCGETYTKDIPMLIAAVASGLDDEPKTGDLMIPAVLVLAVFGAGACLLTRKRAV